MADNIASDIYLIVSGSALSTKTSEAYKSYLTKEKNLQKEMSAKEDLVKKNGFSGMATIGWIFLQYVMQNKQLKAYL